MIINWFESILYGFISGIAEFFPISSHAHQRVLMQMFGIDQKDPLMDLVVHLALLFSIFFSCRVLLEQYRRELSMSTRGRRGIRHNVNLRMDMQLIRKATLPMIIGIVLLTYITGSHEINLLLSAVFLILNGVILFLPERMMQGNKNAGSMSAFDSILIGIAGSLSALCGISRIGCSVSTAAMRGAKRQNGFTWALLLGIPALITLSVLDVVNLFSQLSGIQLWGNFFSYVLSAIAAFSGGYISIRMMKYLITRVSLSGFAYYSWGAAVFSFIIYLTVV